VPSSATTLAATAAALATLSAPAPIEATPPGVVSRFQTKPFRWKPKSS
jgi:hypothetical protein